MSLNTNTDLTEEDAADLQFPKDMLLKNSLVSNCANCSNDLSDIFILCAHCHLNICTSCFSHGAEFGEHKSDHNYRVMNNGFIFFGGTDWTAREEMIMLNGMLTHSNWNSISRELPGRTPDEIKEHYETCYLKEPEKLFGELKLREGGYKEPIIPFRCRTEGVHEPLRHKENAPAGYNAARGDFEYDFYRGAEEMVTELETLNPADPHYKVLSDLQVGVLNCYRRKIFERQRRQEIIKNHGLIMQRKTTSWLHRFNSTITPQVYEKLAKFMQFYTGEGFDYIMEGLHRAGELKLQIARLCEFRKRGIKTLDEAHLYLKLKNQREELTKDVKKFQQISDLNFKYIKMKNVPIPIQFGGPFRKRCSTPLEILGMPGYEKLMPKEQELCRTVRLPPLNYLDLKNTLLAENNKLGFVKLSTARRVLKIDVNKTRKLYDFLVDEGFIKKPKD